MILLHNPVNLKDIIPTVMPYSFTSDLSASKVDGEENALGEEEWEQLGERLSEDVENQVDHQVESPSEQLILEAQKTAQKIIAEAKAEAEEIGIMAEKNGYEEGFQKGSREGKDLALEENREKLDQEVLEFLQELKSAISDLQKKKDEFLNKHCDQMTQLVLAIAEKVINISLKSSSEVIKKMILAATDKTRNKEWAKIHISNYDVGLMVNGEEDILEAVRQISPNINMDIMENAPSGTCIIEFPDKTVDASVSTQIENIKEIFKENRLYGGI